MKFGVLWGVDALIASVAVYFDSGDSRAYRRSGLFQPLLLDMLNPDFFREDFCQFL
jgi:hypothetical protein